MAAKHSRSIPFPSSNLLYKHCRKFPFHKINSFHQVNFISKKMIGSSQMSTVTFTDEFTSPIAAPRLFKALIVDGDNLIPQIAPQAIKNVEILEGNGGPGTIKKINFAEGSQFKYMKHRIDALDEAKMTYSYTLIEGDPLMDKLEKISYETTFEASEDGGTKGKNGSTYYTKPGVEIKEEEIKAGKEKAAGMLKAVEAYLLAKPEIYA